MTRVPEYMQREVEVKLTKPECMPVRAHPSDAGADLVAIEDTTLYRNTRTLVDTGVAVKIPVGFVGLLIPRSSLSKDNIIMTNSTGVIDSDYRGTIKASLMYIGESASMFIPSGTRIVQLVIVPIMLAKFIPFENTWDDTARSTGGFGSTGV